MDIGLSSVSSLANFHFLPCLGGRPLPEYTESSQPTASFLRREIMLMPLFILMGLFVSASGIAHDLYETAYRWLSHQRGDLAMATVAACAGFGAIWGDSMATAVTMGSISLPEIRKYKYRMRMYLPSVEWLKAFHYQRYLRGYCLSG